MNTEYGRKVGAALRAICQLHSDTSKLLVDFDKRQLRPNCYSVFGSYATRDLTYNVKADFWMAEGVYRYYANNAEPGKIEGVAVCFFHEGFPHFDEPLLLLARINYRLDNDLPIRQVCQEWDILKLFFDFREDRELDHVLHAQNIEVGRIASASVLALPLYRIRHVDDVESAMARTRVE